MIDEDDMCTVVLGPGKDESQLSIKTLCSASKVFDRMLNSSFKEAQEKVICFPEDNAEVFLTVVYLAEAAPSLQAVSHMHLTFNYFSFGDKIKSGFNAFYVALKHLDFVYKMADKYEAVAVLDLLKNFPIDLPDMTPGLFTEPVAIDFIYQVNQTVKPKYSRHFLEALFKYCCRNAGHIDSLIDKLPDFEPSCIRHLGKLLKDYLDPLI
eukprot:Platyproteum_vivax@DN4948_c0_g1_i1.p1